jgi:hypothetical protein
LYAELRKTGTFRLDMKAALDVTYNVLKHGPRAPDNFLAAVRYAQSKKGLELDKQQSLAFGIKMAERSYIGDTPPVLDEDSSAYIDASITP